MKDKFIKNGVFSLEYDKETLRDMVLELQEENQKLKAEYGTKTQIERDLLKEENEKLKAELQLYKGALKRENEAIHRANDLEFENQKCKEIVDKAKEYINDNLIISSILDGKKYYTINNYSFDYRELLEILEEKEEE